MGLRCAWRERMVRSIRRAQVAAPAERQMQTRQPIRPQELSAQSERPIRSGWSNGSERSERPNRSGWSAHSASFVRPKYAAGSVAPSSVFRPQVTAPRGVLSAPRPPTNGVCRSRGAWLLPPRRQIGRQQTIQRGLLLRPPTAPIGAPSNPSFSGAWRAVALRCVSSYRPIRAVRHRAVCAGSPPSNSVSSYRCFIFPDALGQQIAGTRQSGG